MDQEQQQAQKFNNENLELAVTHKPACIIEFDAKLSPLFTSEEQKKAIQQVSKQVELPGFRKGKAPESMVLKKHPAAVDKKWQELIANRALQEGLKLTHIPVLNSESRILFSVKEHSLEKGAHVILSFETLPNVPVINPSDLDLVEEKIPEVTEERINEMIRQIRLFFATWKNITDRPVQEGDFVLLNVDSLQDDASPKNVFNQVRFEVNEKHMAKWMRDLIIGKNAGETVEGFSVPDENASEEEKKELKPQKTRVTIIAIQEASLPEFDDAFAKQLGVDDTSKVYETVRKVLEKESDKYIKEKYKVQLNDLLLKKYNFDLPESLIKTEVNFRLNELQKDSEFINYWKDLSESDRRNFVKNVLTQSEKALKLFYLCQKFTTDNQISVDPQDAVKGYENTLEMLLTPREDVSKEHQHYAEVYSRLILDKTYDNIISRANKVEKNSDTQTPDNQGDSCE